MDIAVISLIVSATTAGILGIAKVLQTFKESDCCYGLISVNNREKEMKDLEQQMENIEEKLNQLVTPTNANTLKKNTTVLV